MHTPFSDQRSVHRIAQFAILIQAATYELTHYEVFFGAENVGHIQQGAARLVQVVGEALSSEQGPPADLTRNQRHDLRNHIAVVKGFSDLILMDLPRDHSARGMLESLSRKGAEFARMLDEHRDATSGLPPQSMAS